MNEHFIRYEGWRVVGACSAAAFFATVPIMSFGGFMPEVCQALSWSREAASSAFGTLTLAAAGLTFALPAIPRSHPAATATVA